MIRSVSPFPARESAAKLVLALGAYVSLGATCNQVPQMPQGDNQLVVTLQSGTGGPTTVSCTQGPGCSASTPLTVTGPSVSYNDGTTAPPTVLLYCRATDPGGVASINFNFVTVGAMYLGESKYCWSEAGTLSNGPYVLHSPTSSSSFDTPGVAAQTWIGPPPSPGGQGQTSAVLLYTLSGQYTCVTPPDIAGTWYPGGPPPPAPFPPGPAINAVCVATNYSGVSREVIVPITFTGIPVPGS